MNRRIYGMLAKRLDEAALAQVSPRAALVVATLRRIAYSILTLFRSVTQRSDQQRAVPWKPLMRDVLFALVATTEPAPTPTLADSPD